MDNLLSELDSVTFDFVMSVGPACRPAQQLKHADLRTTAAPMDWMELYPLSTVVHLFRTGFSDFFMEIEDITGPEPRKNRRVVDTKNNITSIHHFPSDKSLEAGQKAMRKTMVRRYQRIHQMFRRGKRFCFVCNRPDSPEALLQFMTDFRTVYPQGEFWMVNVRSVDDNIFYVNQHKKNGLYLYDISFQDVHPDGADISTNPLTWHGNTPRWQEVLFHIHLSPAAHKQAEKKWWRLFRRN